MPAGVQVGGLKNGVTAIHGFQRLTPGRPGERGGEPEGRALAREGWL